MSILRLGGALAEKYGDEHKVLTDNLSEAIRIVDANHPGFRTCFGIDSEYAVFKDGDNIGEDRLLEPGTKNTEWVIEPVPFGSGGGGFFQAVLGVVLIVVGCVLNYFTGSLGTPLIKLGVGLLVGGLATYLSSMVSTEEDTSNLDEDKSSYLFNGPTNKTSSGHSRAICYGEVWASTINIGYNFKHEDLIV